MRFNCDSCGAKYQIADEKVAGKTVRMKCRKCGVVIQVRAEGTDKGVVAVHVPPGSGRSSRPPESVVPTALPTHPPAPAARRLPAGPPRPSGPPRPKPSGPGLPRPMPGRTAAPLPPARGAGKAVRGPGEPDEEATVVMPRSLAGVQATGMQPSAPASPVQAVSTSSVALAAPASAGTQPAAAGVSPVAGAATAASPGASGVVPAPSSAVSSEEAEWFVGIAGDPVGPVPPSYLKKELDDGRISTDSLVWRQDMSEWQPLSKVTPLNTLATPAAEVPPAKVSDPVALMRVKDEASAPTESAPAAVRDARVESEAAPASIDIPISEDAGALAAAETAEESAVSPAPEVAVGEAARPSFEPGPDSAELLELAGILKGRGRERRKRRRGMHPMAWAFVAFSGAFGAVAAYKMVGGESTSAPKPAATAAATTAPTAADSAKATPTASAITLNQVDVKPRMAPKGSQPTGSLPDVSKRPGGGGEDSTPTPSAKPTYDPDDPLGIPVDGPTVGGPSSRSEDSGNGLLPGQVQGVVSRNRRSVSRRCLALVRAAGQTSAKVSVTITVGRSGSVLAVSGGGANKVPGLASCVMSRIRNWRFPASGGQTKVAVPFTFIAQ